MHSAFYTFNSLTHSAKEKQKNNLCAQAAPLVHTATDLCVFGANGSGKGQNNHLAAHSHESTKKK